MQVENTYTDKAWHPPRRRVKYFPVAKAKDEKGHAIVIDNKDWAGDLPVLWSRKEGEMRLLVMLVNTETGETYHARIHEGDFEKLPETIVDW